jgi:hypothetical protein
MKVKDNGSADADRVVSDRVVSDRVVADRVYKDRASTADRPGRTCC